MKNYYHILGLEPTCSLEEIKIAYRACAKHYHPDKHQGSKFFEQKFIEAKEAFDTLSNSETRDAHDEYHGLKNLSSDYAFATESEYQSSQARSDNPNHTTNHSETRNHQQSRTTSSDPTNQGKREVTENDYRIWAAQKVDNNDYAGALIEIGDGMKKFPKSALLEYAEAEVQEAFGYYWRARKSYKRAFNSGIVEAKAEVIRIESLFESGIRISYGYMLKAVLFCIIGVLITIVAIAINKLIAGALLGTLVNIIGGILIIRQINKEVPKRISENFQFYSFEFNLYILLTFVALFGSCFLTAYILG